MTFDMLSPPPLFPEQRTVMMEENSLRSTQSRESLSSLLLAAGCKLYARIPSKLDSTSFRFFFFFTRIAKSTRHRRRVSISLFSSLCVFSEIKTNLSHSSLLSCFLPPYPLKLRPSLLQNQLS